MLCCKFEVLFDGGNQAESMVVVGDHEKLGAWDVSKAPKLKQVPGFNGALWTGYVDLPSSSTVSYKYAMVKWGSDGVFTWEGLTDNRKISLERRVDGRPVGVKDVFNAASIAMSSGRSMQADLTPAREQQTSPNHRVCTFEVLLDGGRSADSVFLVGDHEALGAWEALDGVEMRRVTGFNGALWAGSVQLPSDCR